MCIDELEDWRSSGQQLEELREYVESLPADWRKDSSLETWFPLTAEELKRVKEENAALLSKVARLTRERDEESKERAVVETMIAKWEGLCNILEKRAEAAESRISDLTREVEVERAVSAELAKKEVSQAVALQDAWAEMHCCDDIKLDQPLAGAISDLQKAREIAEKQVSDLIKEMDSALQERDRYKSPIIRCHCCGGTQIWKRNESGEIEVYHDCASGLHVMKEERDRYKERVGVLEKWIKENGRHAITCKSRVIRNRVEVDKALDDSKCTCGLAALTPDSTRAARTHE